METLTDEELKLINTKPSYLNEAEKKERLRIKNRLAKQRQRERMTDEEHRQELEKNRDKAREGMRKLLSKETPEQREERKRKDLERHLKKLATETPEERKRRLEYARKYQKNKYRKNIDLKEK